MEKRGAAIRAGANHMAAPGHLLIHPQSLDPPFSQRPVTATSRQLVTAPGQSRGSTVGGSWMVERGSHQVLVRSVLFQTIIAASCLARNDLRCPTLDPGNDVAHQIT